MDFKKRVVVSICDNRKEGDLKDENEAAYGPVRRFRHIHQIMRKII